MVFIHEFMYKAENYISKRENIVLMNNYLLFYVRMKNTEKIVFTLYATKGRR